MMHRSRTRPDPLPQPLVRRDAPAREDLLPPHALRHAHPRLPCPLHRRHRDVPVRLRGEHADRHERQVERARRRERDVAARQRRRQGDRDGGDGLAGRGGAAWGRGEEVLDFGPVGGEGGEGGEGAPGEGGTGGVGEFLEAWGRRKARVSEGCDLGGLEEGAMRTEEVGVGVGQWAGARGEVFGDVGWVVHVEGGEGDFVSDDACIDAVLFPAFVSRVRRRRCLAGGYLPTCSVLLLEGLISLRYHVVGVWRRGRCRRA